MHCLVVLQILPIKYNHVISQNVVSSVYPRQNLIMKITESTVGRKCEKVQKTLHVQWKLLLTEI